MSSISIIPAITISETEGAIIVEAFSIPAVRKYLHSLAVEDTKELLGFPSVGATDADIAKAHAVTQGKLQVISTLLSIQIEEQPNQQTN